MGCRQRLAVERLAVRRATAVMGRPVPGGLAALDPADKVGAEGFAGRRRKPISAAAISAREALVILRSLHLKGARVTTKLQRTFGSRFSACRLAICPAQPVKRPIDEIEPVLSPEQLALDDEGRRPEDAEPFGLGAVVAILPLDCPPSSPPR